MIYLSGWDMVRQLLRLAVHRLRGCTQPCCRSLF
jgi:hypothetical protein